ncbi:hypothetical protein BDW69DRAFT_127937 [Aspergillus filifer]
MPSCLIGTCEGLDLRLTSGLLTLADLGLMVRNRARLSAASSSLLPLFSCLAWRGVLRRRPFVLPIGEPQLNSGWIMDHQSARWCPARRAGNFLGKPPFCDRATRAETAKMYRHLGYQVVYRYLRGQEGTIQHSPGPGPYVSRCHQALSLSYQEHESSPSPS